MEAEAVSKSYRRWAPVYDRTFGAVTHAGRRRAAAHISARGGSVLEVGVGTGLSLPYYSGNVEVTGIDFSAEMLEKAKTRARREGLDHVKALRRMDARDLEFPDNSFDFVTAMHVISVVPEPERVMAEMARVVKPGGQVLIVNHFAREKGLMATLEKVTAPLDNLLGWHSDFPISIVLGQPALKEVERDSLPPLGMMTWLVLEKKQG